MHLNHDQIIHLYNSVARGISQYYSFAANYGRLTSYLILILKRSCAKLLAAKFTLKTMAKVYKRFGSDLASPRGYKFIKLSYTADKNFKRGVNANPQVVSLYAMKSLSGLYNLPCAICGSEYKVEMHHIRMMKDLNPKRGASKVDKIMAKANRKQVPLCRVCHMNKGGS